MCGLENSFIVTHVKIRSLSQTINNAMKNTVNMMDPTVPEDRTLKYHSLLVSK